MAKLSGKKPQSKPKTEKGQDAPEHFSDPFPDPVEFPIGPELDLHTFSPGEVEPLLEDYLEACREKGLFELRIIHGKGTGRLKDRVRRVLAKNPLVVSLRDADLGGWGATLVVLKPETPPGD